jgi:hypothetical protein
MKRMLAVLATLAGVAVAAWAARTVYTGPLVHESGLAYDKNYTLNTTNHGISSLSATASYSSATVAAQTFTDGQVSTGSITVTSNSNLAGKQGTNTLTVLSTSGLTGSFILLDGVRLTNSVHWYTGVSTNTTATSIKNAINTYAPQFTATALGNVVTITCGSSGTWCNTISLSVVGTSSITAGAATFSGGIDNSFLAINGVSLVQGSGSGQWAVGASSAATANNIATLINANTSLNSIVIATAPVVCGLTNPCGVVKVTSSGVGTTTNYSLYSSSNSQLTLSSPVTVDSSGRGTSALYGGVNASWTLNGKDITITNNPFYAKNVANGQASMVALPVLYSTGSVAIGGLTNQTTYYVIPVDVNTIRLASNSANAQAGTAITLTSSGTPTAAHTYTLTPLPIAGTVSMKWQVSNDGTTWTDLSTPSVTFGLPYTASSTSWDFNGSIYQYYRLSVTAPTQGGLALVVTINGSN